MINNLEEDNIDIIEQLEIFAKISNEKLVKTIMLNGDIFIEAADEIKNLRNMEMALRGAYDHLRSLITAWADADDYDEPESDEAYYKAWFALRKAVGR